jgi:hypothetical protein
MSEKVVKTYLETVLYADSKDKEIFDVSYIDDTQKSGVKIEPHVKTKIARITKTIMKFFNIEDRLENEFYRDTLIYGDSFIEIADQKKQFRELQKTPVKGITNKKVFLENDEYVNYQKHITKFYMNDNDEKSDNDFLIFEFDHKEFVSPMSENLEFKDDNIELYRKKLIEDNTKTPLSQEDSDPDKDYHKVINEMFSERDDGKSLLTEVFNSEISKNNIEEVFNNFDYAKLKNLEKKSLIGHKPHNIIKLNRLGVCLGYLLVEENGDGSGNSVPYYDVTSRFINLRNNKYGRGTKGASYSDVDEMLDKIFRNLGDVKKQDYGKIKVDDKERNAFFTIINNHVKKEKKIKVRYIPPKNMINISTELEKNAPYGTSVIENMISSSKLLTLTKYAVIMSKISRSAVIRKWIINTGGRKDTMRLINEFYTQLKNKNINLSEMDDVKSIASHISMWEDTVVTRTGDQQHVDMELMPTGNPMSFTDLDEIAQDMIADTDIPPAYLNRNAGVEMRETLVNMNVNFATRIQKLQSKVEKKINILMSRLFSDLLEADDFDISDYMTLKLQTPVILKIQHLEGVMSSLSNVIGLINSTGVSINPIDLLTQYQPDIDWEDLVKKGEDFKIKNATEQSLMGQQ